MQIWDGLSSDQKGAIAESAIVHAAARLGLGVLRPLTEGHRYDLVFDLDGRLLRIQCKWAPLYRGVVLIRTSSARRSRDGVIRRAYREGEIDGLAAYCPDLDRCFLLPASRVVGRREVVLRVSPSWNNQRQGVNWADEFAFEALQSTVLGP